MKEFYRKCIKNHKTVRDPMQLWTCQGNNGRISVKQYSLFQDADEFEVRHYLYASIENSQNHSSLEIVFKKSTNRETEELLFENFDDEDVKDDKLREFIATAGDGNDADVIDPYITVWSRNLDDSQAKEYHQELIQNIFKCLSYRKLITNEFLNLFFSVPVNRYSIETIRCIGKTNFIPNRNHCYSKLNDTVFLRENHNSHSTFDEVSEDDIERLFSIKRLGFKIASADSNTLWKMENFFWHCSIIPHQPKFQYIGSTFGENSYIPYNYYCSGDWITEENDYRPICITYNDYLRIKYSEENQDGLYSIPEPLINPLCEKGSICD